MRYFSRFILFVGFMLVTLFCVASTGYCQEQKDRIIITVGAGAEEISNIFTDTYYLTAVKATVNAKVVGNKTRLGAKFVFDRFYYSKRYSAGAELSYKFSKGVFEPYGHILVGREYVNSSVLKDFVRTLGAGVRINLGYLVLNPFQAETTRGLREPFGAPGTNQFSASVGVRF